MQKPLLILLALLVFSPVTKGQGEVETVNLQEALDALRRASLSAQTPGPKAELQRAAKTFLDSTVVKTKQYKSSAFETDLGNLKDKAEAIGGEGPLVKRVNAAYEAAIAYRNSIDIRIESPTPTPSPTPLEDENNEGILGSISAYILPAVLALVILSALALLLYAVIAVRRLHEVTNNYFGNLLPQSLNGMKARQDELAKQIDAAGLVSKDINQQLTEVRTELRLMSRMLQQANLASNRPANYSASYLEPSGPPVNDGPAFPIAADELLRQMHNKLVVVKRDFQNDMLVSDPDGKGELVLLRDSHIAEDMQPLFIVPRVTQFQMRQEYYNFYEKYYECANPESGSVWILDPAVVEKVVGGWELREKGRLEVR